MLCKQNSVHNFHSSLKSSQTIDLVLDSKSKAVTDFRRHADEEMKLSALLNSFPIYADLPSTVHEKNSENNRCTDVSTITEKQIWQRVTIAFLAYFSLV